ncbi:MAG: YqaJ viral recombinase family protein [Steroidobacteraceae bacterium]|nr:YqaJ viral recombinase family protein [Steroidobacteraceae bacterium]MDW8259366.1 YqaJ viral recombinase family protein [Gammaproteobacteria bacterium]
MLHFPKTKHEWLALRHKHINSSEVAALFGVHPYMTAFELAVAKRSAEPNDSEPSERMEWGLRLQREIARAIADEHGVKIRALTAYAVDGHGHCRMGASFDFEVVGCEDGADSELAKFARQGAGVLEIKNVDAIVFRSYWLAGDALEPPAHIELQLQHQLACIARRWGAIGVLVGGNRLEVICRTRDNDVVSIIRQKCERFWDDLSRGVMPPVELPADAAAIAALYRYTEPNKVIHASAEIERLIDEYARATEVAKKAAEDRDSAKARLLLAIGDAERVIGARHTVTSTMIPDTEVPAHTRKGYRRITVTRKEKT